MVRVRAGGDMMATIYQLSAFLRRDWRLARFSLFNLAWQGVAVVLATPTLYYLGRLVPRTTPALATYGGNYFEFAVLGIAFSSLFASVMATSAAAVRQEQLAGTVPVFLTAPAPLPVIVAGACLWPLFVAGAQAALYIVVGTALFHIVIVPDNVAGAAVILLLGTIVAAALGLMAAAFVLLFRRTEPFTAAVMGVSAMLGGVFYPADVLPARAARLAQFVPLTPTLRGLRLALMRGADFSALLSSITVLMGWCAILVPAAILLGRAALTEARRSGLTDD